MTLIGRMAELALTVVAVNLAERKIKDTLKKMDDIDNQMKEMQVTMYAMRNQLDYMADRQQKRS